MNKFRTNVQFTDKNDLNQSVTNLYYRILNISHISSKFYNLKT